MRAIAIVAQEVTVQRELHLLDRLVPDGTALDAQMLVEQGAVSPGPQFAETPICR